MASDNEPHISSDRRTFLRATGAVSAAGLTGVAGCLGSGGGSGAADLTVAHFLPESHHIRQKALMPWMNKVKEKADSEVTFDEKPGGQLGGPGDMLTLIKQGTADISLASPAYLSDQIPLSGVGELPDTFFKAENGCRAYWKLSQNELYETEYNNQNFQVVNLSLEAPYQIMTTQPKIVELGDWSGVNVRSAGGIMSITIEALGGTPVEIQAPEIHTSWDRGVVDGTAIAEPSVKPYDLVGFINYASTNVNLASWVGLWAISDSSYDSLPDDVQTAMREAGKEASAEAGAAFDSMVQDLRDEFSSAGVELYEVPDEEYSRWSERMDQSIDSWIQQMANRNTPGQKLVDAWQSEIQSLQS